MAVEMAVTSYSFDTLCDGNPCCVCDAKCLLKVTRDFPSPQSVASSLYKKFNEIIDELEARRGCQLVGFSIERAPIEKRKTRYFHQLNIMDPRSWDKDALKLRWEAECKRSGRDGIGDGLIVLTVVTQAETPHHYSSHEEYIIKIEEELRNHCMSDHRFQATFSPQQKMKPAVQAYAIYVAITLLAQSSGQVWKGGSAVPAVSQYISAGHTTTVQDPFGACCKTRCLTYSGSKLSGSMHTHQFEESKRHTEVEKQDPSVSRDRQFHSSTLLLSSSGASRKTRSITSGRSKSSGSMHTHQYDEESKKHTEVEKQDPSVSRDRQSHHSSTLSSMSSSGTSCKTRSITYGGSESSRSESSSSMHTHQYDESAIYVEDDCERVDRERIHSQLEDLREEFAQTKERMLIERQRCEQLAEENAKLSIERKKAQEDIKVLTEQVNAYSREVDKQKGLVTQSQEKHKTEVDQLRGEISSLREEINSLRKENEGMKAANTELMKKLKSHKRTSSLTDNPQSTTSKSQNTRDRQLDASNSATKQPVISPVASLQGASINAVSHSNGQKYRSLSMKLNRTDVTSSLPPATAITGRTSSSRPKLYNNEIERAEEEERLRSEREVDAILLDVDHTRKSYKLLTPSAIVENGLKETRARANTYTEGITHSITHTQAGTHTQASSHTQASEANTHTQASSHTQTSEANTHTQASEANTHTQPSTHTHASSHTQTSEANTHTQAGTHAQASEVSKREKAPYDPNLVCPKCGKQYRVGGIQKLRRHINERCTGKED